jgi:hypothetical protein
MSTMATDRRLLPFQAYIEWAKQQGCTNSEEHLARDNGQTFTIVTLAMPNGKWATEVTSADDYLLSTTVARLDRRLGIKSTFF